MSYIKEITRTQALSTINQPSKNDHLISSKYIFGYFINDQIKSILFFGFSPSIPFRINLCGESEKDNILEISKVWYSTDFTQIKFKEFLSETIKLVRKDIITFYITDEQSYIKEVLKELDFKYIGLSKAVNHNETKVRKQRYLFFKEQRKQELLCKLTFDIKDFPKEKIIIAENKRQCRRCNLILDIENFSLDSEGLYRRHVCKSCITKQRRFEPNRINQSIKRKTEEYRSKVRAYRKTKEYLESDRKYLNNKRKINIMFRIKHNLRSRIRSAILVKKWNKTSKFQEYIGCSQEKLRLHLEKTFTEGMSWENYGAWHIDHKKSLSSAKTEEELYKLCHYTNLQALWAADNIRKSNKV